MANKLFKKGAQAILNKEIDLDTDTLNIVLFDATYVVDLSTHDNLDDIVGTARVGTPQVLAGKSIVDGVFDADDPTWVGLTGDAVYGAVIYKDTGVEATSQLIAYFDTITGVPFTPSGGDFTINWDNGASKIFSISN